MRPPQVTYLSSIPCRPHIPWYDEWTSNAFASILQARPFLIFGQPAHIFYYDLAFLRKPFRLHLTVNALLFGCIINRPLRITPGIGYKPLVRGSVGLLTYLISTLLRTQYGFFWVLTYWYVRPLWVIIISFAPYTCYIYNTIFWQY